MIQITEAGASSLLMLSRLQEQLKQRAQMKEDGIEEGILDAKGDENNSNNRIKVR